MRRQPDADEGKQAQNTHQAAGHEGAGAASQVADAEKDEQPQHQDQRRLQAPDLPPADAPSRRQQGQAAEDAGDQRGAAAGLDEADDAADHDQDGVHDDDERRCVHGASVPR